LFTYVTIRETSWFGSGGAAGDPDSLPYPSFFSFPVRPRIHAQPQSSFPLGRLQVIVGVLNCLGLWGGLVFWRSRRFVCPISRRLTRHERIAKQMGNWGKFYDAMPPTTNYLTYPSFRSSVCVTFRSAGALHPPKGNAPSSFASRGAKESDWLCRAVNRDDGLSCIG